jgi:hypothetical protein
VILAIAAYAVIQFAACVVLSIAAARLLKFVLDLI